jgi:hypothetical protein
MVEERFVDLADASAVPWMRGWRCMNCGEVVDRKIYQHRLMQHPPSAKPAGKGMEKRTGKARAERFVWVFDDRC